MTLASPKRCSTPRQRGEISLMRPIRTVEDFQDAHRAIHAYCSHNWVCTHGAQLRLEALAERLGLSIDFYDGHDDLASRMRCSKCGWHFPNFALRHAGKRPEFSGSHGAGVVPIPAEEFIALQRFPTRQSLAVRTAGDPYASVPERSCKLAIVRSRILHGYYNVLGVLRLRA